MTRADALTWAAIAAIATYAWFAVDNVPQVVHGFAIVLWRLIPWLAIGCVLLGVGLLVAVSAGRRWGW